ncbi:MAG: hypothetical protein A2Y16_00050 [Tenericutes bacterium GWF2_57_13]|nr:MAG: hypothetical protein A2Y16_00050 [Tenericutes bacterium GWF2_57_13]
MSVLKAPNILIPREGTDLTRWAVVACDQFTSEPAYWHNLASFIGPAPSTLQMILPEAFLEDHPLDRILKINKTMELYLAHGVFQDLGPSFVLVDRRTPYKERRLGLILAIDLDQYSPDPDNESLVCGTENTVPARIPPRVKIREHASLELPHVMLLMDDPDLLVIEHLYAKRDTFPKVYDFELNMGGGHVTGYQIKDTASVIKDLDRLIVAHRFQFAVGDGNHSLAAAKVCWEALKPTLSSIDQREHPARYAMVELENIYDPGLQFEPIHRVVFNATEDFLHGLYDLEQGDAFCLTYTKKGGSKPFYLPESAPAAVKLIQDYIDRYVKNNPFAHVDYVHGIENLKAVCQTDEFAVGITLPPMNKSDLVKFVSQSGVLPRKTFSMGEATEKRYYLECRKIK